jgi:hypothetical protein
MEGASWWNQALKQPVYKCISGQNLPEDADPMDLRYT